MGIPLDPRIAIIILNWNGRSDTLECLESLSHLSYSNYEVCVVDNASTDGSEAAIQKLFPNVNVILNEQNLGFAGGNNVGIKLALEEGAEYILLLNNDTFVDPDVVSALMKIAKSDVCIGIVGPKIYYNDKPQTIWFAGGTFSCRQPSSFHIGKDELDVGQYDAPIECDYVTGCAMFIKAAVFKRIGIFDERYFLYYEETDFCLRAKDEGFKIMTAPAAKVWHKISSSTGGKYSPLGIYYTTRNRFLICSQRLRGSRRFVFNFFCIPLFELRATMQILLDRESKKALRLKALWLGACHFLIGRYGQGPDWLFESRKYDGKRD